jgi:surface antigen
VTGVNLPGNAEDWKQYINSETPQVGYIAVINAGWWGHVGVVVKIDGDIVTIRSRNWLGLWIVSDDEFDIHDIRLDGYINY